MDPGHRGKRSIMNEGREDVDSTAVQKLETPLSWSCLCGFTLSPFPFKQHINFPDKLHAVSQILQVCGVKCYEHFSECSNQTAEFQEVSGFPNFDGESPGRISTSRYTAEENKKNAGDPTGKKVQDT